MIANAACVAARWRSGRDVLRCRATVSLVVAQLPRRRAGSNSREGRLSQCTQQRSMQPHLQMRAVVLRAARVRVAHGVVRLSAAVPPRPRPAFSPSVDGRAWGAYTESAALCGALGGAAVPSRCDTAATAFDATAGFCYVRQRGGRRRELAAARRETRAVRAQCTRCAPLDIVAVHWP